MKREKTVCDRLRDDRDRWVPEDALSSDERMEAIRDAVLELALRLDTLEGEVFADD